MVDTFDTFCVKDYLEVIQVLVILAKGLKSSVKILNFSVILEPNQSNYCITDFANE